MSLRSANGASDADSIVSLKSNAGDTKRPKMSELDRLFRVEEWLKTVGMAHHIEKFLKAEVNFQILPHLTNHDLENLGVLLGSERRVLLTEISYMYSREHRRKKSMLNWEQKYCESKLSANLLSSPEMCENAQSNEYSIPEWQLVPGSNFVVDRFRNIAKLPYRHFMLTHFHSDHYAGLKHTFNNGVIYCSSVTSRIVQNQLKIPAEKIQEIPLDRSTPIDGTTVTFLDANHCPGAIMIIFEGLNGPPVLHTGDARLTKDFYSHEKLKALKSKKCILVLDTTFCDPIYSFPSQNFVINYIADIVERKANDPQTLCLFGTYTIGKERVFLEVAKRMEKKVYVSQSKLNLMMCMDWTKQEQSLLTTDHEATNLHAIALWKIKVESIGQILDRYGGKYTSAIGIRATGWAYEKGMEKNYCGKYHMSNNITIYEIPYSEHSSYTEMRDFVQWLDPIRIIPSVGNDNGPKLKKMLSWLKQKSINESNAISL